MVGPPISVFTALALGLLQLHCVQSLEQLVQHALCASIWCKVRAQFSSSPRLRIGDLFQDLDSCWQSVTHDKIDSVPAVLAQPLPAPIHGTYDRSPRRITFLYVNGTPRCDCFLQYIFSCRANRFWIGAYFSDVARSSLQWQWKLFCPGRKCTMAPEPIAKRNPTPMRRRTRPPAFRRVDWRLRPQRANHDTARNRDHQGQDLDR